MTRQYDIEVRSCGVWQRWGMLHAEDVREAKRRFQQTVRSDSRAFRLLSPGGGVIEQKKERK